MTELTVVSLSVPADRVPDVVAFASSLRGTPPGAGPAGSAHPEGLDAESVRRAYLGGRSEAWRPFLRVLADHAGEWVPWRVLCAAIGRTPARAAGMLGAAERRCRQYPPYEKSGSVDGERWFRMPEHAAAVVRELGATDQT